MKKINKLQFIKSIINLISVFLFNLPAFAAFHLEKDFSNSLSCSHSLSTTNQNINFKNKSFNLTNIVPSTIDTGDFNNDNFTDLVILGSNSEKFLTVIYGSQDGAFLNTKILNTDFSHDKVYIYNLNNDTLKDIVLLSEENDSVSVILNLGNNNFSNPIHFQVGTDPISLTLGNFNNNSFPDCLVINSGDGNASLILDPVSKIPSTTKYPSSQINLVNNLNPVSVTSLDFNEDSNLDISVAFSENKVITFSGNGKGKFTQASSISLNSEALSIITADLNNDNKLDLVIPITDDSNKVAISLGNTSGQFSDVKYFPIAGVAQDITVAHLNGDCYLDIITANDKDNFSILRGNGNGTFIPSIEFPLGSTPSAVKRGDLNNDGKNDLIFVTSDGRIQTFTLNNDQTTSSGSSR